MLTRIVIFHKNSMAQKETESIKSADRLSQTVWCKSTIVEMMNAFIAKSSQEAIHIYYAVFKNILQKESFQDWHSILRRENDIVKG